ncbi:hypothetical protein CCHR01_03608 [Colletotrichum chrysophilum]|uniref:Uncharacterized protein n=1 Tax=Colletotrichum chrysophilum TaxID=1836956 RepID=A0AAD9AUI6_9PEZI|nr:hypothetical protein CCHR01_03608 [Colletotrichum chrysophilum]
MVHLTLSCNASCTQTRQMVPDSSVKSWAFECWLSYTESHGQMPSTVLDSSEMSLGVACLLSCNESCDQMQLMALLTSSCNASCIRIRLRAPRRQTESIRYDEIHGQMQRTVLLMSSCNESCILMEQMPGPEHVENRCCNESWRPMRPKQVAEQTEEGSKE